MLLDWFNVREAVAVGSALADHWAPQTPTNGARRQTQAGRALQELLRRAEQEVRTLRLNFYKRAKLANSFKWRLLEKGVDQKTADDVTHALVMHLLVNRASSEAPRPADSAAGADDQVVDAAQSGKVKQLLSRGNDCFARGEYEQALELYRQLVAQRPRSVEGLNNIGATLCKLGRYAEAEEYLRRALNVRPEFAAAHANLGAVLRWKGEFDEAETSLRRALKLQPNYPDARALLGMTLALQGRAGDASAQFDKALKSAPRHAEATVGLGMTATIEGRFDDAEKQYRRALEFDPKAAGALAGLVTLRRVTAPDPGWLQRATELAESGVLPAEEASLRFAMGKYFDDLGQYGSAFESYRRGNALLKELAEGYGHDAHKRFVDDMIRVYTREAIAGVGAGASASTKPVLVVGMLRSGTSLVEQIIASHPSARGAGELSFWAQTVGKHESKVRQGLLEASLRKQIADEYLRILNQHGDATRVVDKAPLNSDYLGLIHSVFPQARFIYLRRDPIDTCLSCYFQQFTQALNFTMDLSDLAQYYREHHRLVAHWRAVLPSSAFLEVPYEQLVEHQQDWTRRILDFIGLEWDERCLSFYRTKRPVATASSWQVRQKLYSSSVERWRHYEKFIGPLMELRKLGS